MAGDDFGVDGLIHAAITRMISVNSKKLPGSSRNSTAVDPGLPGVGASPMVKLFPRIQYWFLGVCVWLCFVKLPVTAPRDSLPQSWEAVISFAAAHHLQWGRDIVYTYGPLGFLTSDFYWGNFFWPILLWAVALAVVLTLATLKFLERLVPIARLGFCVVLILLTSPTGQDLTFDAVYFFAITVLGVACVPSERPGIPWLTATGFVFAVMSLVKFSFLIYCSYTLAVLFAASLLAGCWKNAAVLFGGAAASLLVLWFAAGQSLSSMPRFLIHSLQLASGYSSAMSVKPYPADVHLGIPLLICVSGLVVAQWLASDAGIRRLDRVALAGAGIFLAWKEGFVRADIHVIVFFIYGFLFTALNPAMLTGASDDPLSQARAEAGATPQFTRCIAIGRRLALPLTAASLLLAFAPFLFHRRGFITAAENGFPARLADTATAIVLPARFRQGLDNDLGMRRYRLRLPRIAATVGSASIAALNYDQDAAILNGLNYAPQPVFQSYSAYTPELQALNAAFFESDRAPEFVLWRSRTIDGRFPTIDDGSVALSILGAYTPVLRERDFILWRRRDPVPANYSLADPREQTAAFDQWISFSAEPTWATVELQQTAWGALQNFLWNCPVIACDVRLDDGRTTSYRLLSGNAQYGFVLSPLLASDASLMYPADPLHPPARVVAARIRSDNQRFFKPTIRFTTRAIRDIPAWETPFAASQLHGH